MRKNSKIKSIKTREILDSRGNPTVEVDLVTDQGLFRASVPSGASKGKYEAVEIRDGGKRYHGKGVLMAVKNINKIIEPKLRGKDSTEQKEIDKLMLKLDGTKNKSNLGANAISPVSMAICRAGAQAKTLPLYKYIGEIYRARRSAKLTELGALPIPKACFNVINGGLHAGNELDFQEFMVCPQLDSFSKNLQAASEIYHNLKEILKLQFGEIAINVGDEGGFAPPVRVPEEALDFILKAAKNLNYQDKIKIILDIAASQFFQEGKYKTKFGIFTSEELLRYYSNLIQKYPILAIEDPFSEDDWEGWRKLKVKSEKLKVLIIGDDLLATNPKRMKMAKEKDACNGAIIKPNQIGTITETIEAAKLASQYGWKIMGSHRSGETNDDFIADLAVGISADFIKAGAPVRGERVAKYNRLLEIEEEIKKNKKRQQ